MLSALTGVISVALIYLVGRELFGHEVGLLSAFLMAISALQIHYSQEVRYYNSFVLLTLLSFIFCIRALNSNKLAHFVFYVVGSILLFYTHGFGVFVVLAQNLYFFLTLNKNMQTLHVWLVSQAVILLAILPLVLPYATEGVPIAGENAPIIGWIRDPSILDLLRSLYRYILPPRGEREWTRILANCAIAVVVFAAGISILVIRRGRRNGWYRKETLLPQP